MRAADTLNVMKKNSKTLARSAKATPPSPKVIDFDEPTFAEIAKLISASRDRALLSVNTGPNRSLLEYWRDHQPQDFSGRMGRWSRRSAGWLHRQDAACPARVYEI